MGHGLHSIKEKYARASLLRQSNMAEAAARSQRLKQNHGEETTATLTTAEITCSFFFQHSDGRTAFFSIAKLAPLLYQQNCFPGLGMKRFFPLCEELLIFESRSLRRFNRANNSLWNLWRLFIATVTDVENKKCLGWKNKIDNTGDVTQKFQKQFSLTSLDSSCEFRET